MEVKTEKTILAITPPTETENVDSLEIDWDIRRCTPMMNLLKERLVMYEHDKDYEKAGEIQTKIDECTKGIISLIVCYAKVTILNAKGYYSGISI